MPQVLTDKATIVCPHFAMGSIPAPTAPLCDAEGGTVLVEGDTGVISCPFSVPCAGFTLKSMGLNATRIRDRRVILVTDFQQTSTGLPLTLAEHHHVVDDSTPAPLPTGQAAPPLTPAMLDLVPPVISGVPLAGVFAHATQLPPTVVFVFTLSTPFPRQWLLTFINGTALTSADVTNGGVPGPTVVPAGGGWSSPVLVVTVTLTTAFLNALPVGTHYFYMTGVSQRGLSSFARTTLAVS